MDNGQWILNDKHKDNALQELKRMCRQQITSHPTTLSFLTGSSVEIPDSPTCQTHHDYGLNGDLFDVDLMYFSTHICVLSVDREVPEAFVGEIKRIITQGLHPGYARLIGDRDGQERGIHLDLINMSPLRFYSTDHGPAKQADMLTMMLLSHMKFSPEIVSQGLTIDSNYIRRLIVGMAFCSESILNLELFHKLKCTKIDSVFSVHCPYWPDEALEWVRRERRYRFPSKSLIKRVIRYGCDLVHISPKNLDAPYVASGEIGKDIYWRFSFSMAEYLIIRRWTTVQRIVYRTLRCLHKIVLSRMQGTSVMCTYYFKTLMLWECETRKQECWHDQSLDILICTLVKKMISCLEERQCHNYFIPDNNMMDHLTDKNIEPDLCQLKYYATQDSLICDVIKRSEYNELFTLKAQYQMEISNCNYRFLLLFGHFLNSAMKRYTVPNQTTSSEVGLHGAHEDELSDVCQGLYFQREAAGCSRKGEREQYISTAKEYLDKATRLCESSETHYEDLSFHPELLATISCLFQFGVVRNTSTDSHMPHSQPKNLHPKFVFRSQQCYSNLLKKLQAQQKCLLYNRERVTPAGVMDGCRDVEIVKVQTDDAVVRLYSVFHENETLTTYQEGFLPNLPGFVPTVSLSWFAAKAYLANLIYTTECDQSSVIQICDEINHVYHSSFAHRWMADVCLPVFLSTQWTAIYDTEVQTLIGFYSLCSYVLNRKGSREVYLSVCPIHFSIYLKLRCAIDNDRMSDLGGLKTEWIYHLKECTTDKNATNARVVLLAITNLLSRQHAAKSQ